MSSSWALVEIMAQTSSQCLLVEQYRALALKSTSHMLTLSIIVEQMTIQIVGVITFHLLSVLYVVIYHLLTTLKLEELTLPLEGILFII